MPRFDVKQPAITFTKILSYIEQNPGLDKLDDELKEVLHQLTIDYQRRHISIEKMKELKKDILLLLKSVVDLNQNEAIGKLHLLRRNCVYNQALLSKWNLLGSAVAAIFVTATVTLVIALTKGLAIIPLFAWFITPGGSAVVMGTSLGVKIAEWNTKRKVDRLGKSIHTFFVSNRQQIEDWCVQDFVEQPHRLPRNRFELACKIIMKEITECSISSDYIKEVLTEYQNRMRIPIDKQFIDKILRTPIQLLRNSLRDLPMCTYFESGISASGNKDRTEYILDIMNGREVTAPSSQPGTPVQEDSPPTISNQDELPVDALRI